MIETVAAPHVENSMRIRRRIVLHGRVQGVGFRPFIYRRALALGLSGWVRNSPEGVVVEAEGAPENISALIAAAPPNAAIEHIETREIAASGATGFDVLPSQTRGARAVEIAPDLATCADCLRELFDPQDRRRLYPFINCAHCGPRFTIVESLPYDRARTSMRHFPMCGACAAEYHDPANRRFHAEPIACPDCGPRLALWDRTGDVRAVSGEALSQAADDIRAGKIVAVKGVGGFHLVVDARCQQAVQRLRARKGRAEKPFAVIFGSLDDIRSHCRVSAQEAELLESPARPIVLLQREAHSLAPAVAPGNPWLGALLPYAPLHHLLTRALGFPIVATSGNLSDEPIATDEREALARLSTIADSFLVHDRPILRPFDDSVARVVAGRELLLRRARGYAPASVRVAGVAPGVVAVGGHLKSTVALTGDGAVCLSQHIGDLDSAGARAVHLAALEDLQKLHDVPLRRVARDAHPDYASARALPAAPVTEVQHHLAHVVSCMAENGVEPPILGVAFDGAGLGSDGTLWGGEFLRVEQGRWRRVAHLRAFRLPGGAMAMREPRRAALGLLYEGFGARAFELRDLAPVISFEAKERAILQTMLANGVNAPLTSSVGRLFDAFAALAGLRQRISYEGQAAIELEGAALEEEAPRAYPFALREDEGALILDWLPALEAALLDLRKGVTPGAIAAALHQGLAEAIAKVAVALGESRAALSGGCFQNARLTESTIAALRSVGCEAVWHRHVPPNDGGLALGQAVWASWRESGGEAQCA